MLISETQLKAIHAKAGSLTELYGETLLMGKAPEQLTMGELWLWDKTLTDKSEPKLSARLALYKKQKLQIRAVLNAFKQEQKNLSGWINCFREVLHTYSDPSILFQPEYVHGKKPIPFQELLIPFTEEALKSLRGTRATPSFVSDKAISDHTHSLLRNLSRISAACFYETFDAFRETRQIKRSSRDRNTNTLYLEFTRSLYSGGIISFFEDYSVLARQLTMLVEHWVNGTALFLDRLGQDLPGIYNTFFNGISPGLVVHVQSGVTARHTEEGDVYVITFSSRKKLIYKPRSATTDIALAEILQWLNASGDLLPMRSVTVLDRERYSWHAYIPHRACQSDAEVRQYYRRVGQFAALLQVLGSTDYHFGNLVAHGADPVLVDNETLLSPFMRVDADFTFTGDKYLDEGVLHTLSRSHFLLDSRQLLFRNAPSICGAFEDKDRRSTTSYRHVNTDVMIERRTYATWKGNNIPKLGRVKVNPYDYVLDISAGYARALHHFNANKEAFDRTVNKATDNFEVQVRLLIRPTAYYEQLAARALKPRNLRDGVTRSLTYEEMALFYVRSQSTAEVSDLLWRELEMMEHQLIPWFHISANATCYNATSISQQKASVIRYSAQTIFEANLRWLNTASIVSNTDVMGRLCSPQKAISGHGDLLPLMLDNVIDIAEHLHLCYTQYYPLDELNIAASEIQSGVLARYTLGNGLGGILLLFAAIEQLKGTGEYRSTIREFFAPLHTYLSLTGPDDLPLNIGYGALDGVGSVIYALATTSQILQDNAYRDLALTIALRIPFPASDSTTHISLGDGVSGFLAALIKLEQLSHDDRLEQIIRRNAETLVKVVRAQYDMIESPGYMYGAAGTLHVLCNIYQRRADPELLDLISELYALLDEHWSNIPEYHTQTKTRADALSLDQGLAGWRLVQIAAGNIPGIQVDQDTLQRSASKLLKISRPDPDQIQTGLAGRCEPALMMPDALSQEIEQFMSAWSSRYENLQRHLLTPHYITPLFYEGTAGVLYQQLRLLVKHQLPSIIAFE